MTSREMIEIILKAEDQASQVVKQNEQNMKRFGDVAKQANDKVAQSTQKNKASLQQTAAQAEKAIENYYEIGAKGSSAFKKLSKSEQEAVLKLQKMDDEAANVLLACHELGDEMSQFGNNFALDQFRRATVDTNTWKGSLDAAKAKVELLGTSSDSLKGKIQTVGNAIPMYLGNKWDSIKQKVTGLGSHIKTSLGNALNTIRGKLESLGNAFSGLGGVMSSVFGGIGLAGLSEMTIGASVNRERIQQLSYAMLGYGESFKDFTKEGVGLWDKMDTLTNTSLVSLDQLAQSSAVVKQMTGANKDQMGELIPIINDIGQRAILMGKDGSESMSLMQAAGKGINGEFEMLKENFGITKDKLESLGWDGTAEDIEGYTQALQDALAESGDVSGMMDTTNGKLTRLKKYWGLAGRSIGDDFLPYLDQGLDGLVKFLDADNDGALDARGKKWLQYGYGVMAAASGFATVAPQINSVFTAVDNGLSIMKGTGEVIRKVGSAIGVMSSVEELAAEAAAANALAHDGAAISEEVAGVTASASAAGHEAAAVAMETEAVAAETASVSTWALIWPVLAVIAAIAGIAIVVYEVGKAFGWWDNVGEMIEAVLDGVTRLWNAFINNPDVQDLLKGISDGFVWIASQIGPAVQGVLQFLGVSTDGDFDIVRAIIDSVGGAFHVVADAVRGAIPYLQSAWGFLSWMVGSAIGIGQGIYNALKPIICVLLGCSPGIVPALQKVQEVFSTVWNAIAGFIGGVITTIVTAIQPVLDVLTSISNFLLNTFQFAWQTMIMVFNIVSMGINSLINIFTLFLSGQINLQTMLSMVWSTLQAMFILVLNTIVGRVTSFASKLISKALSAGRGFVSGIVNWIASLPGRVATYLYSVVNRIISAGSSWVSNGISAASNMVNGVITNVSQLPGKVYTEFMNIGSRIVSAGSDLVNKAKDIGKNIVDGLLGAMGIHSPGIIQEKVVAEFVNMIGRVGNKVKSAYDTAKEIGTAIVDGFGNPTLETNVENLLPNVDEIKTQIGVQAELSHPVTETPTVSPDVDTSVLDSSNTDVIGSFDNLASQTGNALQAMVEKDRVAYETIRNNDNTQLSAMTSNLSNKMNNMTNNVRNSMNAMVNKNKTGMNTVHNTTKTQLNNIVTKTKQANSKMIESWKTMKEGIVSAAKKIKSDSTTHFTTLESTIGSFYRKLQNPGGFGAGPGNGSVSTTKPLRRTGSSGLTKITNAIRKAQLPAYLSLNQIRNNPLISSNDIGSYITTSGKNNKFSVSDLIRSGNIRIPFGLQDPSNRGAGSWTSGVKNHVEKIKNTSKNWSMKGPVILGKYATSRGFKVKDFINGTPKIDFNAFKQMAEDVFSQCHYEFYYDSNKYGNWMTAFQHGGMNCSDSSDALIAMAHACGLSASKVHGHWNQFGHFWANVEGHKMDTTGWMNQRNWTPSASHAGPAPKGFGFEDLVNAIRDLFDGDDPTGSAGNLGVNPGETGTVEGEITVKHEFINLPENITAEEVARLINDAPGNENWIKGLVKNIVFQKWDLKEKARLEAKNARAGGA